MTYNLTALENLTRIDNLLLVVNTNAYGGYMGFVILFFVFIVMFFNIARLGEDQFFNALIASSWACFFLAIILQIIGLTDPQGYQLWITFLIAVASTGIKVATR